MHGEHRPTRRRRNDRALPQLFCRNNYRLVYRGTLVWARVALVCQILHKNNATVGITGFNGTSIETVQVHPVCVCPCGPSLLLRCENEQLRLTIALFFIHPSVVAGVGSQ